MSKYQIQFIPAIIVKGKMTGDKIEFDSSYDPLNSHTEGQIRSLMMRLSRLMSLDHFEFNYPYEIDGNDTVYLCLRLTTSGRKIYAVVLKQGKFTEELETSIKSVNSIDREQTAEEFMNDLIETHKLNFNNLGEEDLSYRQAVEYLKNINVTDENRPLLKKIFQILAFEKIRVEYHLFENLLSFLQNIPDGLEIEYILDSSLKIANQYHEANIWDNALKLYLEIGDLAQINEKLPIMINSRLKAAKISEEMTHDYDTILQILSQIDDGSMEVATQDEREQYYCMLGTCYEKLGELKMAEDLHYMAVMISESETSPTIYIAESHAYLGKSFGNKFQPEIATREYLTASNIAQSRNDRHLATLYSHQASLYELMWSKFLSSTAIIMSMNSDVQNAQFYAWQSLKRLVNSISHSDRTKRKEDLNGDLKSIIKMNRVILQESSEYALNTLNELNKQLSFFVDAILPLDQERELLNFISTKISAMLPLPPPMILIISNDGRLVLGGEIGAEKWDENILTNDDLFSGALSAIMAILSEVITDTEPLRMLDAGQTQIMIEKSDVCIGALLVDRDLNILRKALKDSVTMMELDFPGLKEWDGYSLDFSSAKPKIESLFSAALENIAN